MKLYTEEQVREAIKMAREGVRSENNIINSLNFIKPTIELPSDEEIKKEMEYDEFDPYDVAYFGGISYMRDKIQGVKNDKQIMIHQELNGWDENVKAFIKEKQMTNEVQEEFLKEYNSHIFRGGLCNVEWFYNELYETRLIEHEGVWYKSGDLIQIKEKRSFLFWYLPFFKTVTYQIDFIGSDCSALLKNPKTKELRTITGNVNVL